jgi:hypothetical protein
MKKYLNFKKQSNSSSSPVYKKGEILVYGTNNGRITYSYEWNGFGNQAPAVKSTFSGGPNSKIEVKGIPSNFFPVSMSFWGKTLPGHCDPLRQQSNNFRIFSSITNSSGVNVTISKEENDTLSLILTLRKDVTDLGVGGTINPIIPPGCSDILISKIVVLYDSSDTLLGNDNKEGYSREGYLNSNIGVF